MKGLNLDIASINSKFNDTQRAEIVPLDPSATSSSSAAAAVAAYHAARRPSASDGAPLSSSSSSRMVDDLPPSALFSTNRVLSPKSKAAPLAVYIGLAIVPGRDPAAAAGPNSASIQPPTPAAATTHADTPQRHTAAAAQGLDEANQGADHPFRFPPNQSHGGAASQVPPSLLRRSSNPFVPVTPSTRSMLPSLDVTPNPAVVDNTISSLAFSTDAAIDGSARSSSAAAAGAAGKISAAGEACMTKLKSSRAPTFSVSIFDGTTTIADEVIHANTQRVMEEYQLCLATSSTDEERESCVRPASTTELQDFILRWLQRYTQMQYYKILAVGIGVNSSVVTFDSMHSLQLDPFEKLSELPEFFTDLAQGVWSQLDAVPFLVEVKGRLLMHIAYLDLLSSQCSYLSTLFLSVPGAGETLEELSSSGARKVAAAFAAATIPVPRLLIAQPSNFVSVDMVGKLRPHRLKDYEAWLRAVGSHGELYWNALNSFAKHYTTNNLRISFLSSTPQVRLLTLSL